MKYITLENSSRIRYERIDGVQDNPWLIFLHEGLGCVEMWKDFPAQLCLKTGCPGLVYDRCGYGYSSPEAGTRGIDYIHSYALLELPQVIQAILPGKKHILIGHSDGGSISLVYASRPHRGLLGIVVEAAHVFVEPITLQGIRQADEAYAEYGPGKLVRYHGVNTDTVFRAWADTWLRDSFGQWNIESLLPDITCPALVLQGEDDQYGTDRQVKAIVSQVAGEATKHILPGCGHAPHREQPEVVLALVRKFVSDLATAHPSS
ncbi:alpha/beta fold hydrolase [Desulfopila sp. IMCC35008]|uniref:alpha/beta fold hydrolase n=1 Tax=Desulfopila sp. IMCC35008 TaxID=2653858 RepID=UPI0013D31852|nr:alpha/beta hydrolase [Desulfopila sp. IMCC35008]